MTASLTVIFILSASLILIIMFNKDKDKKVKNKRILIIGGSSGLGLAIAKKLYAYGNNITITSRSKDSVQKLVQRFAPSNISKIAGIALDSTKLDDECANATAGAYDFIFYCPGIAYPGYFRNQTANQFIQQMDLNFLGMIRSLYYCKNTNKKPFVFVSVVSTAGLFGFPGYSSYSPSKTALASFFKAARLELLEEGIQLKLLYPSAMDTPGFRKEMEILPGYTKDVELTIRILSPEEFADYALNKLSYRNSISLDWFTYFVLIRDECEKPIDYLLFPISIIVVCVSKIYVNWNYLKTRK